MRLFKKGLNNKNVVIPLILILLVGSILRFYGLDIQSFWFDELFTWEMSNQDGMVEVINTVRHNDGLPPLHQLLTHLIIKNIGDSESLLRLPSAVWGVLSILAVFLLGNRLYSYKEGLTVAGLMAVLWAPLSFSQEARSYSMLLLFTILSTYFWITMLWGFNEKTRPSYYIISGYIISATISCYLHYFGLYFIMLQGLFTLLLLIRIRQIISYIFLTYLLIFLAYLPWLPGMWDQIHGTAHRWIPTPKLFGFIKGYLLFLFNKSRALALAVFPLYSFLFIHTFYNILKTKEYKHIKKMLLSSDVLLILWLTVPFIGMYIKSILSTPVLTNRNLIISLPAAYLLLSRSITRLPLLSRYQTITTLTIATLLTFHLVFIKEYYTRPFKSQFREAVEYILEREPIYKNSIITGNTFLINYYFRKVGSDRGVKLMGEYPVVERAINREKYRYIWYVCGHWYCPDEDYLKELNKNFILIDHKEFFYAGVWLFKTRS